MGTRGLYGFKGDDGLKITYCHFDSYPSGLGYDIVKFIKENDLGELTKVYNKIILVSEDSEPTIEQIMKYKKYCDTNVGERKAFSWYCLLRKTQGDLTPYLHDVEHMIDSQGSLDNCWIEYIYIINVSEGVLEFVGDGTLRIPFDVIKSSTIDNVVKMMETDD